MYTAISTSPTSEFLHCSCLKMTHTVSDLCVVVNRLRTDRYGAVCYYQHMAPAGDFSR